MAGSQPPGGSQELPAEFLFATFWLVPHAGGTAADFEGLCEQYPAQAGKLRELRAQWTAIEAERRRRGLSGSFAERLASRHGPGLDPDVSLQGPVEPASDSAGEVLARLAGRGQTFERFTLEGELARGGMGVVLRVWEEDLRRRLAMKVVLGEESPGGGGLEVPREKLLRFLEEARISAQLDHPGIVPVHELGLDAEGRAFFTMKLVRGKTLKEVFGELAEGRGGWTRTRALGLLLRVCEAMAYAHDKRVIHRDLKPANVMVGRFGEVYVMDWGVAKVLDRADRHDLRVRPETTELDPRGAHGERGSSGEDVLVTMDGHVLGTPAYMSPEQAAGRVGEMGPQADVYAIGAMLYHLLSGQVPYMQPGSRVGHYGVWQLVQAGPPSPLAELVPDVPAELRAICERAMARDPRARYPDTSAMAEDLAAYLEGRVVRAYEAGPWAEARKWVGRNRALAASLLSAVLIAFLGLGSVGYVQARGKRAAHEQEVIAREKASDVLRLSALQNLEELRARADELWPPYPDKRDALRAWIKDAEVLLADLPRHRAKRDELRALALPRSEEERAAERAAHPDHARFLGVSGELEAKRRALLQRRDGVAAAPAQVSPGDERADQAELNRRAWSLVAPERQAFGGEAIGLALAQRAQERAGDGAPERAAIGDTLAWAFFALGRDAEALEAERAALDAAAPEAQARADADLAKLERAVAAAASPAGLRSAEEEVARLEAEAARLDRRVDERRSWRFDEAHADERWWEGQLSRLIAELEALTAPRTGLLAPDGVTPDHGWSLPLRLSFAERLGASFAPGGEHAGRWAAALPELRAAYPGLTLSAQMGLVPLGPDPRSGLWEFAHLATGEPPERGPDRQLLLTEGTGVVLVLLPGGRFRMGAQKADPGGPNYDPLARDTDKVREVELRAFLLSKYELTQGQWMRIAGANPSMYKGGNWESRWLASGAPVSLLHPVEQVLWSEVLRSLMRVGLVLPTQAQWEYGARGGTSTPWFTGAQKESLEGAANLVDRYNQENGDALRADHEAWLDDGATRHAPVGSYAPNAFGLHDVAGNVWEWCLDRGTPPEAVPLEEALRLLAAGGSFERELRGGSFHYAALHCRVTYRSVIPSIVSAYDVGARPALNLAD